MYATPKILELATWFEEVVQGILMLVITTTVGFPFIRWSGHILWTGHVMALFGFRPIKCWMEAGTAGAYHSVDPPFY